MDYLRQAWSSIKRGLALAGVGIIIWILGFLVALDALGVVKKELIQRAFAALDARVLFSAAFLASFLFLWNKETAPKRKNNNHLWIFSGIVTLPLAVLFAYLAGKNQSVIGVDWTALGPTWTSLIWHVLFSIPAAIYFWVAIQMGRVSASSGKHEGDDVGRAQLGFLNQIFAPSVLYCMCLFSMGVATAAGSGFQEQLFWSLVSLSVALFLFSILFRSVVHTDNGIKLYVPYIGFGLIVSLSASVVVDITSAKMLAVAIALTFALGVAEVGKRHAQIASGKLEEYKPSDANYFLLGANWSAAVFPGFTLVMISTFKNFSFVLTAVVVSIFVVIWLHMTNERKRTKFGEITALLYGFMLPLSIGVGVLWGGPENDWFGTEVRISDIVLALLAQVAFAVGLLRLAKDTVGVPLDDFFADIWSPENYKYRPHCLFLLLTVNALIVILLLLLFALVILFPALADSLDAIVTLGKKLANSGFIVTFVSLMALIFTFATPGSVSRLRDDRDLSKPKSKPRSVPLSRLRSNWQALSLFVQSGRFGVSWIAGAAAVAASYSTVSLEILSAFLIFFSMTCLTMFGFVVNDISDRMKDQAAGKERPITTGALSTDVAAFLAGIVLVLVVFASIPLGPGAVSTALLVASALIFYSGFSSRLPLLKAPYTAALCVAPFLFAFAAVGASINIAVVSIVFMFILFREILLDAEDSVGDAKAGLFTIAHLFGRARAELIGWIGMAATLLFGQFVLTNLISIFAIYCALGALILSRLIFNRSAQSGIRFTRVSMLLGIFAGAVG